MQAQASQDTQPNGNSKADHGSNQDILCLLPPLREADFIEPKDRLGGNQKPYSPELVQKYKGQYQYPLQTADPKPCLGQPLRG